MALKRSDNYCTRCKTVDGVISYHDYDGNPHRLDGPAYKTDILEDWYYHGKLHRIGGPASVDKYGQKWWYIHGVLHREDGPAYTDNVGGQWWYAHGKLHREDGPAEIVGCSFRWYKEGKLHRTTGPAVRLLNGHRLWYVDGRQLIEDEFVRFVDNLTGEILLPPGRKLTYDRR